MQHRVIVVIEMVISQNPDQSCEDHPEARERRNQVAQDIIAKRIENMDEHIFVDGFDLHARQSKVISCA